MEPYSMCSNCEGQIESREGARWLLNKDSWNAIVCTECAGTYAPDSTAEIVAPPQLDIIIDAGAKINKLQDEIRKLEDVKVANINQLLDEEGYKEGMTFYRGVGQYVVTGRMVKNHTHTTVKVIMYPAKKDGTASKQLQEQMLWSDFIKMWRMQRADQDAYVARHKRKNEEAAARAKSRRYSDEDF